MLLSKEDSDLLSYSWSIDSSGYYQARIESKTCRLHKLIQQRMGFSGTVDHINCDKLDNRRENLRPSNAQLNVANRSKNKNNSTGYKGVIFDKRRQHYISRIKYNGKNIHIGSFHSAVEAHTAYVNKAIELFGEHAHA